MAVIVDVPNPQALLNAIRSTVAAGEIETWALDADGDFTHTPPQWRLKAWFRPKLSDGKLIFRILTPKSTDMNKATYGVYHGRFIEMLLTHFDVQFQRAVATSLPAEGDQIKG
jgi:hypothetical protein